MIKNLVLTTTFLFSMFGTSQRPVHIFMIGDSTMANKTAKAEPERGWGQMLPLFFTEKVIISNQAQNGRSTKSFIDEGRWKIVLDSLHPGDYVIIQFGHNDSKTDSARHTDPRTTYRANLIRFITESRNKGAYPILCTSIVRRKFDDKGQLTDTHGDYPVVTREIAKELNVPLIDMQKKTEKLVSELGPEKSTTLFVYTQPGAYPNRPEGTKDDTHLNNTGATKVAALAVEGMKEIKLPLVQFLK
jgi:pectinesterase